MKVALLLSRLKIGGAERQFFLLARGLAERGHEVIFPTIHPGGLLARDLEAGSRIRHLPLLPERAGANRRFSLFRAVRPLRRVLREENPDVLMSALYIPNLLASLATWGRSIPLVWGIQISRPVDAHQKALLLLSTLRRGRPDFVISNSQAGLEFHRKAGYFSCPGTVIHNGVESGRFFFSPQRREEGRRALGIPEGSFLVARIGRLIPFKDPALFLRAAALAAAERRDLRFVWVAGSLAGKNRTLEGLARSSPLQGRYRWFSAPQGIENLYPAFDLCCSSSWAEGCPSVVTEAMASRVPCLVTDVGASADVVGPTGRVVPPRDVEALARGILAMAALGEEERRALGMAAERRIRDRFSVEAMVERKETILLSVAGQKPSR